MNRRNKQSCFNSSCFILAKIMLKELMQNEIAHQYIPIGVEAALKIINLLTQITMKTMMMKTTMNMWFTHAEQVEHIQSENLPQIQVNRMTIMLLSYSIAVSVEDTNRFDRDTVTTVIGAFISSIIIGIFLDSRIEDTIFWNYCK